MPFCQKCGKENAEDAQFCSSCGAGLSAVESSSAASSSTPARPRHVENHLAKAILATLFCCLPLGIVSIVHAASVNGKLQAGDIDGAVEASQKADSWANWSIGLGLIIGIFYAIAIMFNTY